jgi:antitoxin (DNA-binding transcriptional repressor) of toxin-antitoxin stability system
MAERKAVKWTIARARHNFPTLVDLAAQEPQDIYRRDELVARVVPADAPVVERPSARELIAELQRICSEEKYELPLPPRVDRPNAMVGALASSPPRKRTRSRKQSP